MRSRILAFIGVFALVIAGGALAGCGSDNSDDTDTSGSTSATKTATPGIDVAADADISAAVPAEIKSKGTLTIAADATYPPDEFIDKDGKTVIGMDADLAKALGQVMGLDVEVVNVTFDSIIPGLAADKYDLGMSSFTDTKEREATVDFVTYLSAGSTFYAKTDGPDVATVDDLCGLTVAVEKGTIQADDATAQDAKCTDGGEDGVTVQVLPDQNAANLAISSGRADVGIADTPVAVDIVNRSEGQFEVKGNSYDVAPYGIAIPKDNGMAEPVKDAIAALIADGTYAKIMDYWGLSNNTIDTPEINGAVS